ncbi:MAG: hypothetical protein AAGA70_00985 [Pseudomonadota bacterium]
MDPDFAENGCVYLHHVVEINLENPDEPTFNSAAGRRLLRIAADAANPNVANLST